MPRCLYHFFNAFLSTSISGISSLHRAIVSLISFPFSEVAKLSNSRFTQ